MSSTIRIIEPSPLGLAVMSVLFERPSHPYEIQRTLRERGKDQVIDFKPAAVYRMVDRLVAAGFVEEVGTDRAGKRPERTVYRLSEDGAAAVQQWLGEMLTKPTPDFPTFVAAVAFLPLLLPDAVRAALEMRAALLDGEIARSRTFLEASARTGFPRIFALEEEVHLAHVEAEAAWVKGVAEDLAAGRLSWDQESLRELSLAGPLVGTTSVPWRKTEMA